MGKFFKINCIQYKRQSRDRNNPNEIDQEENYTIYINSDFIHNVRKVRFLDSKNKEYFRYHVNTIANNNISAHLVTENTFNLLLVALAADPGVVEIN